MVQNPVVVAAFTRRDLFLYRIIKRRSELIVLPNVEFAWFMSFVFEFHFYDVLAKFTLSRVVSNMTHWAHQV